MRVLGFQVADLSPEDLVAQLGEQVADGESTYSAFALHIGGLLLRRRRQFRNAMFSADLVYADGISAVLLARAAGASRIRRCATTDMALPVLLAARERMPRPVRVACVGGPEGLATAALAVLADRCAVEPVFSAHGYQDDWTPVLQGLAADPPDVLFVGLGVPLEMEWVSRYRDELEGCPLVVTCGGWFGHLLEIEKRAPHRAQSLGMEWLYRLGQAPKRLAGRYLRGLLAFPLMLLEVLVDRLRRPAHDPRPRRLR